MLAGATEPSPRHSVEPADSLDQRYEIPAPGRWASAASQLVSGARVSFLRVLPGMESPYLVRHRRDEVVYIVASGRGQFLVDGDVVEAPSGTLIRVSPETPRAWRNTSLDDFCLIVVQARARRPRLARRSDAEGLVGPIRWPR